MKRYHILLLVIGILVVGCAASGPHVPERAPAGGPDAGDLLSARDRSRLAALGTERAGTAGEGGYRIGPDDLLEVRIPDLLDQPGTTLVTAPGTNGVLPVAQSPTFQQGVRVDAHGDISLPLVGTVRASERTPTDLEQEIARRLVAGGILVRPRVSVQVVEHRSHVVAVVGSVERPGVYPLTRPEATLADMIWAAGGPTKDAGRRVVFVPAGSGAAIGTGMAPDLNRLEGGEAIHLDLESLLRATGAAAGTQNPRVRPGDIISVAPAGTVQVDGWVGKPGSYPITRSLTLSGAVAAAGGKLFPADTGSVSVIRTGEAGARQRLTVDLDSI